VDLAYFVEKQGLKGTSHDVKLLKEKLMFLKTIVAKFWAQSLRRMVGNSSCPLPKTSKT
jgi:hypothetical protein